MGSNWSKLNKYVERGDEDKVLEIYLKSTDIKRKLNANSVVNEFTLDTYMHWSAKHGMSKFLKHLLYDNHGNPNKMNKKKQTVLHKVCDGSNDSVQYECMQLLLQWKDPVSKNLNTIDVNVNAKDENENTPLHYAAMRNLSTCIQCLVSNGAYLFVENLQKSTPCDLAEKNGHKDIALYLESKMIFSKDEDEKDTLENEIEVVEECQNFGLRIQDLQEEKDKLLIETADMLHVNIFTAEILLKKHSWSKQNLLNSWIEDAQKCCEKCGLSVEIIKDNNTKLKLDTLSTNKLQPDNLNSVVIARKLSGRYLTKKVEQKPVEILPNKIEKICGICFMNELDLIKILCGHQFCKQCWEQYLTIKIEEGNVSDIVCPQTDCFAIIPHDVVESLVSKQTAQKYLHFDIRAFVDSNPSYKWCPYPECGMAVRNPRMSNQSDSEMINDETEARNSSSSNYNIKDYSRSVDCGNGHYFCWDCLQEGHEPASCKNWKEWFEKILEIRPEELNNTNEKEELSANYLWLVSNSKKCPNQNCNAPIQKNEGCNHVKCYKCKHDFCWICLEPWKKHSSATGGYFQCNRYEVSNKLLQKEKTTINQAEEQHSKAVELNKFVHYYTRFKNHELSYKIEQPLLAMAKTKFEILTSAIQHTPERKMSQESSQSETDSESHIFIEEAIRELLRSRRILQCSYVYGYYLDTFGHKKFIFEFIQTEFEECTENLSQIIARPYLKTPKQKIIRLTNLLKKKRLEFLETITQGLNNFNDTPPTLKKYSRQRWKYLLKDNIQNDDEFKNAIALSLKELNPKNPWIVDRKGRHTNLLALLNDWPELEHDLDKILVPSKEKNGLCARWDCGNFKSVNSLSGSICNYCSIKCMRIDHDAYLEQKKNLINYQQLERKKRDKLEKATTSRQTEDDFTLDIDIDDDDDEEDYFDMGFGKRSSKNSNFIDVVHFSNQENYVNNLQLALDISLENNSNKSNISTINLPYEPFFIATNEKDLSNLIRNIGSIIYDENGQQGVDCANSFISANSVDFKTSKICNFSIKNKTS